MKVDRVIVGDLECNCYLIDINGKVLIVDPGDDALKIINKISNRDVVGIIVTHYHFDHIGALDEIINKYNVMVYDINNLVEGKNKISDFNFCVIYTLGHKEDAITLYFEDEGIMFTGDFIFRNCVGRCDLPGGNPQDMIKSIEKIKEYKDCLIYPGHGDSTTLGYEIENNIYFKNSQLLID